MSDMVTVEVGTLEGQALDWAVAKCEGKVNDVEIHAGNLWYGRVTSGFTQLNYSTNWAQGGPIIVREGINLLKVGITNWKVTLDYGNSSAPSFYDPAPLVAAMRCYVTSRFGNTMEIPAVLVPVPSAERKARL